MSILIDGTTRVLVQGITGHDGAFHTASMMEYGTRVVGGVTPGKGGQKLHGLPVFNNVREAVSETGANCSVIFVPARFAAGAIQEAADGGIALIVCITEGIPVLEMIQTYQYVKERKAILIGPNCPGAISPGKSKVGIMPGRIHREGEIGVISRSGTLTYEIVYSLSNSGFGQSTCIGIGGDPIIGTGFVELLKMFEEDGQTAGVALIGEIGGEEEEKAADYFSKNMGKPVVSFISGRTAPPGKRMGHAGAIISGTKGTAQAKIDAFEKAGIPVASRPDEVPRLLKERLKKE
jgi:succinyl-CoA synthetase alpha subunit